MSELLDSGASGAAARQAPANPPDTAPPSFKILLLRLFITRELVTFLSLPMAVYVDALLLDIDLSIHGRAVASALALTYCISGLTLSLWVMGWLLYRALRQVPGEARGRRLERLLALPWKLVLLGNLLMWVLGGFIFNTSIAYTLPRDAWTIPLGMAVATGLGLLNGALLFVLYERMLMPLTLEEFQRCPDARPSTGSFFRPRHSWFLPYVLASLLFGTLIFTGTVVGVKIARLKQELVVQLSGAGRADLAEELLRKSTSFRRELQASVGGTIALLLCGSVLTAWRMGRRQRDGTAAIYASLEGLINGASQPPHWVSTDELGDLAAGVWMIFDRLQALPRELRSAAQQLAEASTRLSKASGMQQQTLERQAAALHETVTTAEEIQQSSMTAQSQVQYVLRVSAQAAELGRSGKTAIEQSVRWLKEINSATGLIREQVDQFDLYARKITHVVQTVKSLADRSNLLAVNAAIQAVSAGEHGRSFNVVAREFRSLADQSRQATHQVSLTVEELGTVLQDTSSTVDKGAHRVSQVLERLEATSMPLMELASQAQQSATVMRALTGAVSQQHQGVGQLFVAIQEALRMTEDTLAHLQTTRQAALTCEQVSRMAVGWIEALNAPLHRSPPGSTGT